MYDTGKDLLDAIRSTPDTLNFILRNVTEEQARGAVGGDEGWSVIEVLCHMRDAEERTVERTRQIHNESNPFLAGYDQDAWATERDYASQSLQSALSGFLRFREQYIKELEGLSPSDWSRPGRHEEQGDITIADLTLHIAAHDSQHMAQLARQLG